jgi:uncharacterized protein (TIGR00299 family) protein
MLAYVDCFSGISGDMLLGALIDAGVSVAELRADLATLPLAGYQIVAEPIAQHGLRGTAARVVVESAQPAVERTLAGVEAVIRDGQLSPGVRERALAIFRRLASAEANVHGVPIEQVHFHEVGAVDAIVDIVGVVLGLERLGVTELYCSELPLTSGRVRSAHGDLPVPAPATLELLRGTDAVFRPLPTANELVTPTGAAIVATLARFERPTLRIRQVGHGFGERDLPWANCLRLLLGEAPEPAHLASPDGESDTVTVIEANIDDMTGEALGWLMDRLLDAGALDVSLTAMQMKKNRPATHVAVIARPEDARRLADQMLRESTTLGVRFSDVQRIKAQRRREQIPTTLGAAWVKLKIVSGELVDVAAEYDDARALAARHGMPLRVVMATVEAAARARFHLARTPPSEAVPGDRGAADI